MCLGVVGKNSTPWNNKKNILCCVHNFSETLWSFQSKLTVKVKTWKHKEEMSMWKNQEFEILSTL